MKISFNWLKNYLDLQESPEKVAAWLTDCGLEVEALEKIETIKGGLEGMVIGEVLACEKHPDADRLTLTRVHIGDQELPIVCGAPNVATGQKVVVATVGATLYPQQGDPFVIKKAKIRGQKSEGMICAEDELGLGNSHEGIMVLDPAAVPGTAAADYFKIEHDYCIEIGLTPNRIDAASHLGVARDLLAVMRHLNPDSRLQLQKPEVDAFFVDENTSPITIEVEDSKACPRYSGLCISGVEVKESPDWLKNKLRAIGLKPINNLVDITNFVLHETGQPLHAFDADKIQGNKVIIRKPVQGTTFVTLDNEEVTLTGDDLMICDAHQPMCMAGILGGMDSGVTEATRNVFLESAYFDGPTIRKSSKKHLINTDASFRFERGADPEMTIYALKRAAMMIKEIAGGKITSRIMDEYPHRIEPHVVDFSYEACDRLTGRMIDKHVIKSILESLEISIEKETPEGLRLKVPAYRVDVTRQADVVEEILRIFGYNHIELPERLHASIVSTPKPDKERLQNIASDMLSSRGFAEIMNNSLSKAAYYENDLFDASSIVHIVNPLSQELNVMRQDLLFGGLETIAWNHNRKVHDLKLYEFGNIYIKEADKSHSGSHKLAGYREQRVLAMFMTGHLQPESWKEPQQPATLFDLKAEVLHLLQKLNLPLADLQAEELHQTGVFETGLCYQYNGNTLFELGEVSSKHVKSFDLKQQVLYARVNWDLALELTHKKEIAFTEIPRYPEVRRDLALLIDQSVRFQDIETLAYKAEKKLLRNVRLFDIYRDEKIGKNMKSYAVSFTLQDTKKTLTDKEIDKVMQKISSILQKETGAAIR